MVVGGEDNRERIAWESCALVITHRDISEKTSKGRVR